MNYVEFELTWSNIHGNVKLSKVITSWLKISYFIARQIFRGKAVANYITSASMLLAFVFLIGQGSWWGIFALIFSLIMDGLDGSIAILSKSNSLWGAFYDSFADRICEAVWSYAVFLEFGKNNWIGLGLIIYWLFGFTQEYLRARTISLGASEVGVVTISERVVRAIFIIMLSILADFLTLPKFWIFYLMIFLLMIGMQKISIWKLLFYYHKVFNGFPPK